MEGNIEVQKDNVTKSVAKNLISDYLHMGWKIVENKEKKLEETPKVSLKKNLKD